MEHSRQPTIFFWDPRSPSVDTVVSTGIALPELLVFVGDYHGTSGNLGGQNIGWVYVGDEDPHPDTISNCGKPVFEIPGNHDREWGKGEKLWEKTYGESIRNARVSVGHKKPGPLFSILYGSYMIIPIPGLSPRKNGSPSFEDAFESLKALEQFIKGNFRLARENGAIPVVVTHEPIYRKADPIRMHIIREDDRSKIIDYLSNHFKGESTKEAYDRVVESAGVDKSGRVSFSKENKELYFMHKGSSNPPDGLYLTFEKTWSGIETTIYKFENGKWFRLAEEWKEAETSPERAARIDDIMLHDGKLFIHPVILLRLRELAISIGGYRYSINLGRGEKLNKQTKFLKYDDESTEWKRIGKKKGKLMGNEFHKDKYRNGVIKVEDLYVELHVEAARYNKRSPLHDIITRIADKTGIGRVINLHGHIHNRDAYRIEQGVIEAYDCSINPHYAGRQGTYCLRLGSREPEEFEINIDTPEEGHGLPVPIR